MGARTVAGPAVVLEGRSLVIVAVALDEIASRLKTREDIAEFADLREIVADACRISATASVEETGRGWLCEIDASRHLDSEEAATMLDVSPRRARQRASEFGGQRVGGRWYFDRQLIEAEAKRRGLTK